MKVWLVVVGLIQDRNNYDPVNSASASEPQGGATLHYFMNIGADIKWATGRSCPHTGNLRGSGPYTTVLQADNTPLPPL